jgi:hypothetical protein
MQGNTCKIRIGWLYDSSTVPQICSEKNYDHVAFKADAWVRQVDGNALPKT